MFKISITIFLMCSFHAVVGQQNFEIDSLLSAADASNNDTVKMKAYDRIGRYYEDNNSAKAVEYFEKAKIYSTKLKDNLKTANLFYDIGFAYLLKGKYDKSLFNYQESLKGYEKLNDSFRISNALISIGNVYLKYKDYNKTADYYNKAEAIILAANDSLQMTSIYDTKGVTFDQQGQYDSSLFYHQKAYDICLLINDYDYAMNSLSNMGLTYKHQFKTTEALNCFYKARDYWEAKEGAPLDILAGIYNNIAATHSQASNYPAALDAFNKSIALAEQTGSPAIVMENYLNMSDMFGKKNDYKQQVQYLKQYHQLKDSIFNLDTKNELTQLEADYQVEKKNIELVRKDAEVVKQKSQRNIFITLTIAAAAILIGLVFFYNKIKKANNDLEEKNSQINQQKNELQTLNQVKDRLFSIISHDLRNPLATLKSYLSLSDNDTLAPEKKLQFKLQTMNAVINTSEMLDNLLAWANVQIKNTRATIVPISIEDLVWDTVQTVTPQATQKDIRIEQHLSVSTALGDYDILSIALRNITTNAIKYSNKGKSIQLNAERRGEDVVLSVHDEGIGMTTQQIDEILNDQTSSTQGTQNEKGSGLGLFLVKELLQKMNASLTIESTPGMGSTFNIILSAP